MKMQTRVILVFVALFPLSGCVYRSAKLPDGTKYVSASLFTDPKLGPVEARKDEKGFLFRLDGYEHQQQEVAKEIADIYKLLPKK